METFQKMLGYLQKNKVNNRVVKYGPLFDKKTSTIITTAYVQWCNSYDSVLECGFNPLCGNKQHDRLNYFLH